MTGPDPIQPVTAAVRADSFRIWEKNRARVEQDIVEGRPFDAFVSERGRFDAMFDFLLRSGLWTAATEMRPAGLKRNHGLSCRVLTGAGALPGMAGLGPPAHVGAPLTDGHLLGPLGVQGG